MISHAALLRVKLFYETRRADEAVCNKMLSNVNGLRKDDNKSENLLTICLTDHTK